MAYGGWFVENEGELPTRYRVSSAVAALALSGVAWLVLAAGSKIVDEPPADESTGT